MSDRAASRSAAASYTGQRVLRADSPLRSPSRSVRASKTLALASFRPEMRDWSSSMASPASSRMLSTTSLRSRTLLSRASMLACNLSYL